MGLILFLEAARAAGNLRLAVCAGRGGGWFSLLWEEAIALTLSCMFLMMCVWVNNEGVKYNGKGSLKLQATFKNIHL